jgi:hypothetical protein
MLVLNVETLPRDLGVLRVRASPTARHKQTEAVHFITCERDERKNPAHRPDANGPTCLVGPFVAQI